MTRLTSTLRFRPPQPDAITGDLADAFVVAQMIDHAMRPGNFFVAADLHLNWIAARSETIAWEIFRGRLVDAAQTRERTTFLSWHASEPDASEPTIAVRFDVTARQIHVTRGLLAYVWEGYDTGGGVIESREVTKWARELVGTITLADFSELADVQDELICLIWQAVVGTSRLPLSSVEAPLPAFVFGKLHYVHQSNASDHPMLDVEAMASLAAAGFGLHEVAKAIEFALRRGSAHDSLRFLGKLAESKSPFVQNWHGWTNLWRELFNAVSLSPQTMMVEQALMCTAIVLPGEERTDFDGHLLRQLGRHLTAYDLVTFHHRGANYPDALLLDEVLTRFVATAESFPELFLSGGPEAPKRRRALRQACLLRVHYEGHRVPDLPTSTGENSRVLPASHPRVPEEQLAQPARRRRQLFADKPLRSLLGNVSRQALAQSVPDLGQIGERIEMGLGLFIDRPLGYAKAIGEPDLTPMLAHEAFSPSIARRRWAELKKLCAELGIACDATTLDPLFENGPWPAGLPHMEIAECPRPTAALCDVRKVADDFVILRTKPVGLKAMLDACGIDGDVAQRAYVCIPILDESGLTATALFDQQFQRVGVLRVDARVGFFRRAGVEIPRKVSLER